MPAPIIPDLPDPPTRGEPGPVFRPKAATFLEALVPWGEALQTFGTWVTDRVQEITNLITAADIAFDQKLANAGFTGESTTSNTIALTGGAPTSKTWTLEAGLSLVPGAFISAADTAAPNTNYLTGQVTSYNDTTGVMVALMDKAFGSGTKTSWVFSLLGRPGSAAAIADITGLQAALDAKAALRDTIIAKTASYAVVDADCGAIFEFNSATDVNLTIAAARGAGFNCQYRQIGAGKVVVVAGSGATIQNRQGYTKTAGAKAQGIAQIASNGTDVYIDGDLIA